MLVILESEVLTMFKFKFMFVIIPVLLISGLIPAKDKTIHKEAALALEAHLKADSLFDIQAYEEARGEYYRALKLKETVKDTLGAALCRLGLAQIAFWEGYYSKSLKYIEDIQPFLEAAELYPQLYALHMTRGKALSLRWQFKAAAAEFNSAAAAAEKMGDPHRAFLASETMGRLSLDGKRDEAAILHFTQALLRAPNSVDSGYAYKGLARALTLRKDYAGAVAYFDSAAAIASSPPDTALLAEVYGARGDMNHRRGDYTGAVKYYSQQLELVKAQGDELRRARILMNIAVILEKQKKIAWALELMEEAVNILERNKSPETEEARKFLQRLRAD